MRSAVAVTLLFAALIGSAFLPGGNVASIRAVQSRRIQEDCASMVSRGSSGSVVAARRTASAVLGLPAAQFAVSTAGDFANSAVRVLERDCPIAP